MGVYLRVDEHWQPGANTIAYYPLTSTSTVNDMSGNINNMTQSGTVTFGVNGGVNCAYFDGGYLSINKSLITGNNSRTVSYWFYRTNAMSEGGAFWGMGNPSSQNGYTIYVNGTAPIGKIGHGNWQTNVASATDCPINGWNLMVLTFDGTTVKAYLNNNEILSTNFTLNLTSGITTICQMPSLYSSYWKGYMSNFIVEDKVRTAQEMSDYYNGTKSDYGL